MRILIIADQALFRQGLRSLLQALRPQAQLTEVAEAAGLSELPAADPDLLLVKLPDTGVDRTAVLPLLRQRYASTVLIALSGIPDAGLMREALAAGAAGYIPATIDPLSSLQALQQVLEQGVYLPSGLMPGAAAAAAPALPVVPAAQRRLLLLLLQGLPEATLLRRLGGSVETLRSEGAALWARLGVADRVQALYLLAALGWPGLPSWQEELNHAF
jgi:DNA-binding NarL/FixJ family response regulator